MTENNHSCDVLVIGGGLAGLCAAISASDCGASVILVNKGITGEADHPQSQLAFWQHHSGMVI